MSPRLIQSGQAFIGPARIARRSVATTAGPYDAVLDSNKVLHLRGEDGNGAAPTDSGYYRFAVTVNGDAACTTSQAKFDNGSIALDGTGDYLTVPANAVFQSTSSDSTTWECWIRPTTVAAGSRTILEFDDGSDIFVIRQSATDVLAETNISLSVTTMTASGVLSVNTWAHVRVTRNGSSWALYVNGVQEDTASNSATVGGTGWDVAIGSLVGGTNPFTGQIDEFVILDGVALAGTGSPPTIGMPPCTTFRYETPTTGTVVLQLSMDGADASTTFTDDAGRHNPTAVGSAQIDTAQSKFGGASALFNGSTDDVSISDSDDFSFGSGDFTIEFWARNAASTGAQHILFEQFPDASNYNQGFIQTDGTIYWNIREGGVDRFVFGTSATLTQNVWRHVAFVRNGSEFAIYVDGVKDNTATYAGTLNNLAAGLSISRAASLQYNGHIDEFRIVKGEAIYTSDFTPPVRAFPTP